MCAHDKQCTDIDACELKKVEFSKPKGAMRRALRIGEYSVPFTKEYNEDLLGIFTYYTKVTLSGASGLFDQFQKTKCGRVLFGTTQPAHFLTLLAVTAISMMIFPERTSFKHLEHRPSSFLNMVYIVCIASHFGAQMWMTFVSGLALYFTLPRHNFGDVQKCLFPKYFLLNACLSFISLTIYLKSHPDTWDWEIKVQVSAMTLCFLTELLIRLYLTPPLLRLMTAKNMMEKKVGVGMEVGKHSPGVLSQCDHYVKLNRAFRKVHMTIAIGNLLTMACTTLNIFYLSSKICIL